MPESKLKFLVPAIGAVVAVTGGIAVYTYLFKGPSGDISGAIGSAKLVPESALMTTYISTDDQVWAKLQQFGTPEAQKLLVKSLEDFNKNTFKGSDISYDKDIKPWISGVMIAVLPPSKTQPAQLKFPTNRANPPLKVQQSTNMLMVIGIKDKLTALNFASKLKNQKGVKSQEIDYKGEKITETTEEKGRPTYSVVVNNSHLILSPDKQAVEKAIDTYKGQPSFASKEGANRLLSQNVNLQNTLVQVYVPDYSGMVEQWAINNTQGKALPPQTLSQLKQVKSMVAGVGIDDQGVRVKAIANLDPQLSKFQYQNTPAKILSQFPGDTFALISGNGISRGWQTFTEQSKDYPEVQQTLQQIRTQLKSAEIDLDKEVFGWMDGEFGIGAVPSNQGVLASVGFGGALVFDTSDRKTAEATFTKLDNIAKAQGVNIATRNIGGKDVTEWQIPKQGALLSHAWLDQDTVFLAVGEPVAEALAAAKSPSLDQSDTFKNVTGSLQQPNGGYFYVDMDKTVTLVNRLAGQGRPIPPDVNALLSSIRGFAATATSPDKSTSQLEVLLALKPSQK
ncbi:DUF3352 domain-containing protein [Nostoc sp. FACHB-87]|uniref:DUF3352 domain-containing protein n=1 Tax=Nostocales TaxID=1161 RepID=UPI001686F46A|nr:MULTISPECIES: DUF3352 domain-containing protein [Nostocales]MBD2455118.1 DUF3352 domain-containing protein [Nostoc sp. FACHB-87]MBD2477874.1 DUF3352 domain-containing protein [Anabaena sp. FACHB-83]MBD2487287.1 DUF3352 domain-containing protein [Aulosira sp. FACHB-615]